jgi:hypothetical protein
VIPQVKAVYLNDLPFPILDNNQHEIVKLVDQLLQLNEEKYKTTLPSKLSQLEGRIDYCEGRINEIVYELYGLTDDEIKIIELGVLRIAQELVYLGKQTFIYGTTI